MKVNEISYTIRYASMRLSQEDERERRGLPSTVQYWAAYIDGTRAQRIEDMDARKQEQSLKEARNDKLS